MLLKKIQTTEQIQSVKALISQNIFKNIGYSNSGFITLDLTEYLKQFQQNQQIIITKYHNQVIGYFVCVSWQKARLMDQMKILCEKFEELLKNSEYFQVDNIKDVAVILQSCVDKNYRNKQVGSLMFQQTQKKAKRKFKYIVSASNIINYGAIIYQAKNGFSIVGNFQQGSSEYAMICKSLQ